MRRAARLFGGRAGGRIDPLFWFGVVYLVFLLLFALFGPGLRHDPMDPVGRPLQTPNGEFWLGTDAIGRDVFARLAHGARNSLLVGLSVQAIALVVGTVVGVIGVYGPRWLRGPLMRFTDGIFAFPDILLAILIIGVWSQGLVPVIVALSITAWPAVTRLVRTQVAALKEREFVVAARALGAPLPYVVARHVLPHILPLLLAVSMVEVAGTILAESALSFLGIGVQAPEPSWGSMIEDARQQWTSNPEQLIWPCVVLSATIFALNFVGDGLRARLDPRGTTAAE